MCGRPIHRREGEGPSFLEVIFAQYPLALELCWSDQEVRLYSVRSRVQKH